MHAIFCPVCKNLLEVSEPVKGREVECPECGEIFSLISTDPLDLFYRHPLEDEPLPDDEPRIKPSSHLG